MRLKIASRSSDLARWQAVQVGEALKNLSSSIEIEYFFKSSFGDQNLDLPLAQMESKGVFTQDFYVDLKEGRHDLVVHSWKDLPVEEREGTMIAATLKRADARDIFLVPKTVWQQALKSGVLHILTSSPRRIFNLESELPQLLPDFKGRVQFDPVRGNIPSRVGKMFKEGKALILAKAAFDRMLAGGSSEFESAKKEIRNHFDQCHFMVLPLEINPCAPAQGALAIEIARDREDLKKLLDQINDPVSFLNAEIEREILKAHGGGCHQKIGVTHITKPFGVYHVEKGESENRISIDRKELLRNREPRSFKGLTSKAVFPLNPSENKWFERSPLSLSTEDLSNRAIMVARCTEGMPNLHGASQVWTSGLKTWKKLAERGQWVNGCFEGLGEQEVEWVGPVAEGLTWVKLTHSKSPNHAPLNSKAYYELKPSEVAPDLSGKSAFFWMSSTSFKRALELYPKEVLEGFHACGPGHTYEFLRAQPGLIAAPEVFLSLSDFHDFLKRNGLQF
ncbi:MAG: hydroxymethylbilane synthase [Bdellovibrionales bacterium]|nr:hydroxymethylbilane synthase [Bdellovibrionales bacterium]